MRCCAPQPRLLAPVGIRGVFSLFEVEPNLVETLLRDIVFVFAEFSAIDDCVDRGAVAFEAASAFDEANAFEAEGVPDFCGSSIGLKDEVEDRVGVVLVWSQRGGEGRGGWGD